MYSGTILIVNSEREILFKITPTTAIDRVEAENQVEKIVKAMNIAGGFNTSEDGIGRRVFWMDALQSEYWPEYED